jgi:hypothetical protein
VTRFVVRAVRSFFDAIRDGRVQSERLTPRRATDRSTAGHSHLVVRAGRCIPIPPGSGSEAFKGIGVRRPLLPIGASGIVNQAVSGFMLMYTRALRPGEYVQIGDIEGTVTSVGYLTTRLETLRREEINMPNALVASTVTRNYSRLATEGGLGVAAKVTIGYDVPAAMRSRCDGRHGSKRRRRSARRYQTALNGLLNTQ